MGLSYRERLFRCVSQGLVRGKREGAEVGKGLKVGGVAWAPIAEHAMSLR